MTSDEDRIRQKAHELWEAEGRPHGRDQEHWDQAKEIVALHDSASTALLPRDAGAEAPVEEARIALDNEGQAPGLTDTGEHDLTSTDREPALVAAPVPVAKTAAKTASGRGDAVKRSPAPKGSSSKGHASKGRSKAK